RGDQLTIENVSFEGETELVATPTFIEKQGPVIMIGLRYLMVPIAFIVLYLLFLRPLQKAVLSSWLPAATPDNQRALPRLAAPVQTPLTVKQFEAQLKGVPHAEDAVPSTGDFAALAAAPTKMETIRQRVVEHAQSDPETVARLVRMWLSD